MLEKEIISCSAQETEELAKKFASGLKGGEVIALEGDLGAGKTTFVKGIAKGMRIKQNITSPTFVLMKTYKIENCKLKIENLVHVDCYRLKSTEDALSLGITDYLGKKDAICLIEWADKIKKLLSKDTVKIKFKYINENKREIKILRS